MSESVILFGATGAVGRVVLRDLLASNHFTKVIEAGRRVTSADALADAPGKEKLVQKTVDFENLDAAALKDEKADVVVVVLGTNKAAAGSAENFIKIDREYAINAGKAAKSDSPNQRLIYLSAAAANPTSMLLYTKSKGLTEQGLALAGYKDFVVFRPGMLLGAEREKKRPLELLAGAVASITPVGGSSLGIPVTTLAKSIVKAAELGSGSLPSVVDAHVQEFKGIPPYHIISNKGAIEFSNAP